MTSSNTVLNVLRVTNTDDLPPPDVTSTGNSLHTDLPDPASALPNIVDSGRICFGGAFRLSLKK
jgi:hypothetical protein